MILLKYALVLLVLIANPLLATSTIEGLWKHSDKPAWLEVNFDKNGEGRLYVQKHKNNPDAVGLTVIKAIRKTDKGTMHWRGQMYSAAKDEYVEVVLMMSDSNTLLVLDPREEQSPILKLLR